MNVTPRSEHPRPQFIREEWMNLNGPWQFELDLGNSGLERHWETKDVLKDEITVPFCPESKLSGIEYTDFVPACWYKKEVFLPESWSGSDVLLHFGAVNYETRVWVNQQQAIHHLGGYSSFSQNITSFLVPGKNTIVVLAQSDVRAGRQPSGKQSSKFDSYGCFYTRTTGIWQTVWLEAVPKNHVLHAQWSDVNQGGFHLYAQLSNHTEGSLHVEAAFNEKNVGSATIAVSGREVRGWIKVEQSHLWTVEQPNLYDLTLTLKAQGTRDEIKSYAGLRQVSWNEAGLLLNGQPVFMRLVLDQGFYPDGVITAPTDDALKEDIILSKALGFNGARLHQKMFEPRFMYWADRLGYILWGEHGNWGMDIKNGKNLPAFLKEWLAFVQRDISSPALIGWCPLNETQKDTDTLAISAIYHATKIADPTRPVIDTSGWVHSPDTDIYDYHDYAQDPKVLRHNLEAYTASKIGEPFPPCLMPWMGTWQLPQTTNQGQPVFLSEFGGIGWIMGDIPESRWGYGGIPESEEAFFERFEGLVEAALTTKGICGFCYTQLTDVEQEINGLYTYERQPKFETSKIRPILTKPAWNE